jgi:hypothetical protein
MYPKKRDMKHGMIAEGDSLVFYPDIRKAVRRLNLRFLMIVVPFIILLWVIAGILNQPILQNRFPHLLHSVPPRTFRPLNLIPWLMTPLYFTLYFFTLILLRRQRGPLVTLSPEGITIHALMTQVGLIHWEDIREVRTYKLLFYRMIGIVPFQLDALYRRVGFGNQRLLRLNSWIISLYQMFGVFIAPINISSESLTITADELTAHIQKYRAASLVRQAEPGVWPPPPTAA